LFLEPEDQAVPELREALLAQFALLPAELRFERLPVTETLSTRMSHAQARAEERQAIAVVWVEPQADGRWLVYLLDARNAQFLVRQVDAGSGQREAAIEAVAVIVREALRGLLEGEPVAAQPLPPPEPPKPAPEPKPEPPREQTRRVWRLFGAYAVTDFAREVTLQHGARLGVSFHALDPFHAGLQYLVTAPLEPGAPVGVAIQRYPFTAYGGARWSSGQVSLDAELGFSFEVVRRRAESAGPVASGAMVASPEPDRTRYFSAITLRGQAELRPLPYLGLAATLGVDVLLNNFSYVSDTPTVPTRVLRPHRLRPVAELGVAFYP
jgi:hypothetical protein